ncbi:hypothetical protein [Hansschlegelia sp. KR7-227]|uniref:hypothetical protein n=1 Tax=Hansschlegelia sp. KR7-227 TaxID=3400914 RepID=UPI003BFB5EC0
MIRVPFHAALIAAASLWAASPAAAADRPSASDRASAADLAQSSCRGPRVEVARYEEQICERGVSGYASCRWVDREHEVRLSGDCRPTFTAETAHPATRGAFPPYPRLGSR